MDAGSATFLTYGAAILADQLDTIVDHCLEGGLLLGTVHPVPSALVLPLRADPSGQGRRSHSGGCSGLGFHLFGHLGHSGVTGEVLTLVNVSP